MKIIWWNGPQDIKATKSEESGPTVERQKRLSPLIDIHSSIKAIHKSLINITDIHNSVMYIRNSITNIHADLHHGEIVMDILDLIMDVNYIMAIHNGCELYP